MLTSIFVLSLSMVANMAPNMALAADGILGVANKSDGTASFINVRTGATKTVKVGYLPHEVVIGNGYAYVSNYGSAHIRSSDIRNEPGNTLSVIRLQEPYPVTEVDLGPARCAPHGMAISKDWLFATCEGRNEIAVVDLKTHSLSHTISTKQAGSHLIALSSDGTRAYVSNFWHGTVSVIDVPKRTLIAQVFAGRGSEGIGISADDNFLFVTRVEENEIVKIDTRTLKVDSRKAIADRSSPIRVWPSPISPDHILVNNVGSGKLQMLKSSDLELVQEIQVGRQPIGLAVSDTHYAFVANMKDNDISMINLKNGQVERTFPTGMAPDGLAFHP